MYYFKLQYCFKKPINLFYVCRWNYKACFLLFNKNIYTNLRNEMGHYSKNYNLEKNKAKNVYYK